MDPRHCRTFVDDAFSSSDDDNPHLVIDESSLDGKATWTSLPREEQGQGTREEDQESSGEEDEEEDDTSLLDVGDAEDYYQGLEHSPGVSSDQYSQPESYDTLRTACHSTPGLMLDGRWRTRQQAGGRRRAPRRLFTRDQLVGLRKAFSDNPYPSPGQYEHLASSLKMQERSVRLWFQNMRARTRKRGPETVHQPTRAEKAQLRSPKSTGATAAPVTLTSTTLSPGDTAGEHASVKRELGLLTPCMPQATPCQEMPTIVIKPEPGLQEPRFPPKNLIQSPTFTSNTAKVVAPQFNTGRCAVKSPPGLVSPVSSDNPSYHSDSSRTPSPRVAFEGQKALGSGQQAAKTADCEGFFASMTETVLPPDHPFCNLVQSGGALRRRRRVRDSLAVTPTPTPVKAVPTSRHVTPKPRPPAPASGVFRPVTVDPEQPHTKSRSSRHSHRKAPYAVTQPAPLYPPFAMPPATMTLAPSSQLGSPNSSSTDPEAGQCEDQPLDLSTKAHSSPPPPPAAKSGPQQQMDSGNQQGTLGASDFPFFPPHPNFMNFAPMCSMLPFAHTGHPGMVPMVGAPMAPTVAGTPMAFNYFGAMYNQMAQFAPQRKSSKRS